MSHLVRFLVALSLAVPCFSPAAHALDTGDIVVTSIRGEVHVSVNGAERTMKAGGVLETPASIRTGRDGAIELKQGATSVSVGPDTLLEFPAQEKRGGAIDRIVQPRGNAFYSIGKRDGRKLRVETPYLVGVIKGTQFNVAAQDDVTTISLFEGRLEVLAIDGNDVVDLAAGEIASRKRGAKSTSIMKMDGKAPSTPPRPSPGGRSGGNVAPLAPAPGAVRGDEHADSPLARDVRANPVIAPGVDTGNGNANANAGANVEVRATVSGVDAGTGVADTNASVTAGGGVADSNANVSTGAGVADSNANVSAGIGAADTNANVNTGAALGANGVDAGANVNVTTPAASVDVGTSVNAGTGGVSVDVGVNVATPGADVSTNVNIGVTPGAVDVATNTSVDAGAASVGTSAAADVGATTAAAVDTSASVAGVDTGVAAAVNATAGTVDLGVNVAGVNANAGVDPGLNSSIGSTTTDTTPPDTTTTTPVIDVGSLLDGLLRRRGK